MFINKNDADFDKDSYVAWQTIHNNHPIIVNKKMDKEELFYAKEWLRERNITFLVYRMMNTQNDIRFKFQSEHDALLFRLQIA